MPNKFITPASILAAMLAVPSAANAMEGPSHSIRFGGLVNPDAKVAVVEYEKMFRDRISIGARLGKLDYEYSDGSYDEDGDGKGAEFLFRFYPQGNGFKGFWFGVGVGYWMTDWSYTDPTDVPAADSGETESIDVNVSVGWKIPLGTKKFYIDPSITIGNYFGISTDSTFDSEPELGVYAAAGVAFGINF